MSNRNDEQNLLITLGVVFTQALVDIIGKERSAVDFAITPNGHICIFDTNPGGAGYANQLTEMHIMKKVIGQAYKILSLAKEKASKDMLLDKFTLRYMSKIDIHVALAWMNEEFSSHKSLPPEVKKSFPNATEVNFQYLLKMYREDSHITPIFYAHIDHEHCDYNKPKKGWVSKYFGYFDDRAKEISWYLSPYSIDATAQVSEDTINQIEESFKKVNFEKNQLEDSGLYPIAQIDNKLFFTNNIESAHLDSLWGSMTLYYTEVLDRVK